MKPRMNGTGLFTFLILVSLSVSTSSAKEKVRVATFDPPQLVHGLLCSSARYTETGVLYRADLAQADTLLGWIIPSGSMVHYQEDGITPRFCFLSENTLLDSLSCRGSGHNWMTCFHLNGKLRLAWLAEDTVIEGVPVRKATFWRAVWQEAATRFHDNGRLKQAWLKEDFNIQGRHFYKGQQLLLDEEGKVISEEKPLGWLARWF